MPDKYYSDKLYPLQDAVLSEMQSLQTGFYLTGGTALGRCYLHHRYSDDLDFFVNAVPEISRKAITMIAEDILNGRKNRMRHLFKSSHSRSS